MGAHAKTLRGLRRKGLAPRWRLSLIAASLVAALGVLAFGGIVWRY